MKFMLGPGIIFYYEFLFFLCRLKIELQEYSKFRDEPALKRFNIRRPADVALMNDGRLYVISVTQSIGYILRPWNEDDNWLKID